MLFARGGSGLSQFQELTLGVGCNLQHSLPHTRVSPATIPDPSGKGSFSRPSVPAKGQSARVLVLFFEISRLLERRNQDFENCFARGGDPTHS